ARRPHHDSACTDRIPRSRRCRGPRPRNDRTGNARGSRRLDWTWGWPRPHNFARPQETFVNAFPRIGLLRWVLELVGSFPTSVRRGVGTQGFEPSSTGFSHGGSDPRLSCEPWVTAPVC